MATTLLPIDPAMSPERMSRVLSISASLLPEETVAGRRARRVLVWVVVIVILVAGLCGVWFAAAYHQKQSAERDLEAATAEVRALQVAQRDFAETVEVQNDITTLTGQLKTVMKNDLGWGALLETLRRTGAPAGIQVGDVNGQLDAAGGRGSSTSSALPSTNPATAIGSLVVTGSAPDKQAVAAYVEALAEQTTVTNPYITSVATDEDGGVTFSLTADITQESLCGRFTATCKPSGGK